jgi:hypothetical protein
MRINTDFPPGTAGFFSKSTGFFSKPHFMPDFLQRVQIIPEFVAKIRSSVLDCSRLFCIANCSKKHIRSSIPTHRVVPAGDGENLTSVSIQGFLVDANQKPKSHSPL